MIPPRPCSASIFAGIGAGVGTPGIKIPKLGSAIGRAIAGRLFNSSGGGTDLHNSGVIYKGAAASQRELTRADFTGACLMADIGISTPIRGQSIGCFLCGLSPMAFQALLNPLFSVVNTVFHMGWLDPSAIILWEGDTRGLVAAGTAYRGIL